VLLLVDPAGPACHTGETSCFFEDVVEGEATT
jgi:phosphoribosyl-AMP cyclohydrolase